MPLQRKSVSTGCTAATKVADEGRLRAGIPRANLSVSPNRTFAAPHKNGKGGSNRTFAASCMNVRLRLFMSVYRSVGWPPPDRHASVCGEDCVCWAAPDADGILGGYLTPLPPLLRIMELRFWCLNQKQLVSSSDRRKGRTAMLAGRAYRRLRS